MKLKKIEMINSNSRWNRNGWSLFSVFLSFTGRLFERVGYLKANKKRFRLAGNS